MTPDQIPMLPLATMTDAQFEEYLKEYNFLGSNEPEAEIRKRRMLARDFLKQWSEKRCSLCLHELGNSPAEKFGNNPDPLELEGRCCNSCNAFVLFARTRGRLW